MAERSVIVCVGAQDLDPIRIDIEPDLPGGDLHRRPYRYPVMPVDALSDREFDLVHARRVDAQSAEVAGGRFFGFVMRDLHAIILSHGWRAAFAGPVPLTIGRRTADPSVSKSPAHPVSANPNSD